MDGEFAEITSDMPKVNQNAVDAANQSTPSPEPTAKPVRLKKDGTPAKTPGRKPGAQAASKSFVGTSPPSASTQSVVGVAGANARKSGEMVAEMIISTAVTLGGTDFIPIKDAAHGIDEQAQLRDAWGRYAETAGWSEPPPAIMVLMATGTYVGARMGRPAVMSRFAKAKAWLQSKYLQWKLRGEPAPKVD